MSDTKLFNDIDSFIAAAQEAGIVKVAMAEIDEKRAEKKDQSQVEVISVQSCDLLGYSQGILFKCTVLNADLDGVYRQLANAAFQVTRRSRNII